MKKSLQLILDCVIISVNESHLTSPICITVFYNPLALTKINATSKNSSSLIFAIKAKGDYLEGKYMIHLSHENRNLLHMYSFHCTNKSYDDDGSLDSILFSSEFLLQLPFWKICLVTGTSTSFDRSFSTDCCVVDRSEIEIEQNNWSHN